MLDSSLSDSERIETYDLDIRNNKSDLSVGFKVPSETARIFKGYINPSSESMKPMFKSPENLFDKFIQGDENADINQQLGEKNDDAMTALTASSANMNFGVPMAYPLNRSNSFQDYMDPNFGLKQANLGKHVHSPNGLSPETPAKKKREAVALALFSNEAPEISSEDRAPSSSNRFNNDFYVKRVVGSGTFGCVQCCVHKVSGVEYAVKRSKRAFVSKSGRQAMLAEVETMAELSAASDDSDMSHIVRYYAGWIEDEHVYLQMEMCETSVEALIGNYSTKFENKEIYRLLRHVFLGLKFIHSRGLVHLDIKPGNILKKHNMYKISDFGLALHTTDKGRAATAGSVEEGDSRYLAKEMLDWTPVEDLTKCDIFAVGVMGFELSSCCAVPAQGDSWHTLRNDRWVAPLAASNELVDILSATLNSKPHLRPSAEACLAGHLCLMSDIEKELHYQKLRVEALRAELSLAKPSKVLLKRHHSVV